MTTFIPRRINAKASKAGKTYWEIETEQGNATCFEYPIVQVIEQSIGKPISLYDLETNEKGFINIRLAKNKPQQALQSQISQPANPQLPPNPDNFKEARQAKDVSIYTSYAKDLFIEMMKFKIDLNAPLKEGDVMSRCVELIKQAKVSFERSEIFKAA